MIVSWQQQGVLLLGSSYNFQFKQPTISHLGSRSYLHPLYLIYPYSALFCIIHNHNEEEHGQNLSTAKLLLLKILGSLKMETWVRFPSLSKVKITLSIRTPNWPDGTPYFFIQDKEESFPAALLALKELILIM